MFLQCRCQNNSEDKVKRGHTVTNMMELRGGISSFSCILISNQLNGIYWGCIQGNIIPEGRYLISYRSPFIWSFIDNKSVLSPHQVEVKLERHRQLDVIYFGYWGSTMLNCYKYLIILPSNMKMSTNISNGPSEEGIISWKKTE